MSSVTDIYEKGVLSGFTCQYLPSTKYSAWDKTGARYLNNSQFKEEMKTVNQTKELRKMRILHCPEDCVQGILKETHSFTSFYF